MRRPGQPARDRRRRADARSAALGRLTCAPASPTRRPRRRRRRRPPTARADPPPASADTASGGVAPSGPSGTGATWTSASAGGTDVEQRRGGGDELVLDAEAVDGLLGGAGDGIDRRRRGHPTRPCRPSRPAIEVGGGVAGGSAGPGTTAGSDGRAGGSGSTTRAGADAVGATGRRDAAIVGGVRRSMCRPRRSGTTDAPASAPTADASHVRSRLGGDGGHDTSVTTP